MKLVVVIVTFNCQNTIGDCLASVLKQDNSSILVVDNNSQDKTVSHIKQKFPQVKLIELTENLGFAGGNNMGINFTLQKQSDYILILNPDTQVLPGCFSALFRAAKSFKDRRIFGPKIYLTINNKTSMSFLPSSMSFLRKRESKIPDRVGNDSKNLIWSAGGELDKLRFTAKLTGYQQPDNQQFDQQKICDFISGTCMLVPTKLFQKGLRFHEPYFMYYEDVEFCLRAKRLGFTSHYIPQAKIIHNEMSQTGKFLDIKKYYLARNHLLFVERNVPFTVKLRETIRLPKTVGEHIINHDVWSLTGIRDYFLRRFGPYAI